MQAAETRERESGTEVVPAPLALRPVLPQLAAQQKTAWPRLSLSDAVTSRRVFVLLPFAMIVGLVAYAGLPVEPEGWALAAVGATISLTLIMARKSVIVPLCGVLAAGWLGFCLLPLHGMAFGTTVLARPAFGYFEARVEEIVSATAEGRRIVISGITPVTDDRPVAVSRARLVTPPEPALAPGDIIRASMRLAPVPGPILPGAFDNQFHAYFAGIGAYGNVTGDFELVRKGDALDATRAIEELRMAIGSRIDAVLEGPSAAIGRAMVMGDQSWIDDHTRDVMAESGLAHIYSISGLHLSIVAGGMYFLLRLGLASIPGVATRWPVKRIAAAAGIVAALAIILIDPASVFRASFQLSFAAVVALIGVYEIPRPAPVGERGWGMRLWGTLWTTAATSFIAGTATLLFSAYHFQQTAPLGVLGNVLVLPVVSLVIMPFAVLSVLAMPLGVEAPFVSAMGWGIDRMVDAAVLVAGWSAGWMGNPLLTHVALLIGLAALAWFAFINTWWRLVGPAVLLPLILLVGMDVRPDLLISDTTQAVALRTEGGYGLIKGKADSFAVDVWSDHYQEAFTNPLPETRCDALGCIARTEQFSLAVINNAAAFAEDCGLHALIIARMRVPSTCRGGQIIDSDALAAGGVHWLKWDEAAARFEIRTAIPNLTRPWRAGQP